MTVVNGNRRNEGDTPSSPRTALRQSRKHKALQTRWKVLEAAREEFIAHGYHDTTMAAIAKRAGVAVQTVYLIFRTKALLIEELVGIAVMGTHPDGTSEGDPEKSEWFASALSETDARRALAAFVDGAIPVYARAAAISQVGRAAAKGDPDIAAWWVRSERMRIGAAQRVVAALEEHGMLRPGLTVARGTAILSTVLSDHTYLEFTVDNGWTDEELGAWLKDALPALMIRDAV
jgi:AcrR family transcriptional regulator